jgi:hypothetical protein
MFNKCLLLLSFVFCLGSGSALASDLRIDVQCPQSVKGGAALDATVNISNDGDSAVTVGRALATFAGNTLSTVTGIGLFGPFSRPLNVTISAGGSTTQTVRIMDSVSTKLRGKVAIAMVTLTSADFKTTFGTKQCFVEVQ